MQSKIIAFNKVERSIITMEERINSYLEGKTLRLATVSESSTKGKLFLTLFTSNEPSNTKVKVFRDQDPKKLNKSLEAFVPTVQMRLAVQCSSNSYLTMIVFYSDLPKENETGKSSNGKKEEVKQNG